MNQKDEIKKVIDRINQEQLPNTANAFDMRKMADDPASPNYSKVILDKPSDIKTNTDSEPTQFSECDRFAKSHAIDQEELKQNKGMKLNQKTHSPADNE